MLTQIKHHFYILAILVASVLPAFSQKLTWFETTETKDQTVKFLGEIDGHIFTLTDVYFPKDNLPDLNEGLLASSFLLEKYHKDDMSLVFSKRIVLPKVGNMDVYFGNIYLLEDQFRVFFGQFSEENNKEKLFTATIDTEGELSSDYDKIYDIPVDKKQRRGGFQFRLSPDKSKMLIAYATPHEIGGSKEAAYTSEVDIKIFLASNRFVELKHITESIVFKDGEHGLSPSNSTISNDGCIYLLVKKARSNKRSVFVTKSFIVHMYDPSNGFELKQIPIEMEESPIGPVLVDTDDNGNLIGVGLYGAHERGYSKGEEFLKGSIYFKVDRAKEELDVYARQEVGINLHEEIFGTTKANRGNKRALQFFLPRRVYVENGRTVFLAEYAEAKRELDADNRPKDQRNFQNATVLVFDFNERGEHNWVKYIHKNQYLSSSEYPAIDPVSTGNSYRGITESIVRNMMKPKMAGISYLSTWNNRVTYGNHPIRHHSFISTFHDGTLSLFFHQSLENMNIPLFENMKKTTGLRKLALVGRHIPPDGTVKRTMIEKPTKESTLVHMNMAFPWSENSILVVGTRKKIKAFGILSF
ncbi:MAG: hypothetical protein AB8F95_16975 [Bacteroidia bacterium]